MMNHTERRRFLDIDPLLLAIVYMVPGYFEMVRTGHAYCFVGRFMALIGCPTHFHVVGIDNGISQQPDVLASLPRRDSRGKAVLGNAIDYIDVFAVLDIDAGTSGVAHMNILNTNIFRILNLNQSIVSRILT